MLAPIRRSGSTTRPIGRRSNCFSPLSVVVNGCPANTPVNSRIVVPERTQSSGAADASRPPGPRPCTVSVVALWVWILTPSARRQLRVARQSPEGRKPVMWLDPSANAPSSNARWEIDLSPGTVTHPRNAALGDTVNRLTGTSPFVCPETCRALHASCLDRSFPQDGPSRVVGPGNSRWL